MAMRCTVVTNVGSLPNLQIRSSVSWRLAIDAITGIIFANNAAC